MSAEATAEAVPALAPAPAPGSHHPTYALMITEALLLNRTKDGASRPAIKKFILDNYGLDAGYPYISRALKAAVSDGTFTTNGYRFKLSPATHEALKKERQGKAKSAKKTAKKKAAPKKKKAKKTAVGGKKKAVGKGKKTGKKVVKKTSGEEKTAEGETKEATEGESKTEGEEKKSPTKKKATTKKGTKKTGTAKKGTKKSTKKPATGKKSASAKKGTKKTVGGKSASAKKGTKKTTTGKKGASTKKGTKKNATAKKSGTKKAAGGAKRGPKKGTKKTSAKTGGVKRAKKSTSTKKIAPAKRAKKTDTVTKKKPAAKRVKHNKGKDEVGDEEEKVPSLKRAPSVHVIPQSGLSGEVYRKGDIVYEANLAVVHIDSDTDIYHKVQIVKESDSKYHLVQASGRTGTRGACEVKSFDTADEAVAAFEAVFLEKSGAAWSDRDTYTATEGKYSLAKKDHNRVQQGTVMWKYYMDNGVDGKKDGWYDYAKEASEHVEATFQEFKMNKAWLTVRSIKSGHFSYHVNFSSMSQMNLSTKKTRKIQRFVDGQASDDA